GADRRGLSRAALGGRCGVVGAHRHRGDRLDGDDLHHPAAVLAGHTVAGVQELLAGELDHAVRLAAGGARDALDRAVDPRLLLAGCLCGALLSSGWESSVHIRFPPAVASDLRIWIRTQVAGLTPNSSASLHTLSKSA